MSVTQHLRPELLKAGWQSIKQNEGLWAFCKARRAFPSFIFAMLGALGLLIIFWSDGMPWIGIGIGIGISVITALLLVNTFFLAVFVGLRGAMVLSDPERTQPGRQFEATPDETNAELDKESRRAKVFAWISAASSVTLVVLGRTTIGFGDSTIAAAIGLGITASTGMLVGVLMASSIPMSKSKSPVAMVKLFLVPIINTGMASLILYVFGHIDLSRTVLGFLMVGTGFLLMAFTYAMRRNGKQA